MEIDEIDLDDVTQPEAPETPETPEKPEGGTKPQNDDLSAALKELNTNIQNLTPKQAEQATKGMTEEEKEEFWAVYRPDKEDERFFHKFFGLGDDADEMTLKEKKALFGSMQSGLMRQVFTGLKHLMAEQEKRLREEYEPVKAHVTQAKARETRETFNKAYPALAEPKYDKILKAVASELSTKQFKSNDEFFKALAEGAAETIKQVLPDFDLGASAAPQKKPGSTPKLPRTSVGGSGGIGAGAAKPEGGSGRDRSAEIFD